MSDPGGEAAATDPNQLADDLTAARQRGLADLDLDARGQARPALGELERLARIHASDFTSARIPLIRRLLDEGTRAWKDLGREDEAGLVRRLFFNDQGPIDARTDPRALRRAAIAAWDMREDAFDNRRRAIFRQFAEYLIGFVAQVQETSEPEPLPGQEPEPLTEAVPVTDDRSRAPRSKPWLIVAAVVIVIVVAAIITVIVVLSSGKHRGSNTQSIRATGGPSHTATPTVKASPSGTLTLTFDDLGSDSSIIDVYPGVQATSRDKTSNGTYRNGEHVRPICRTTGRTITSDTSAGERPRQSNQWVKIVGTPGLTQYATLTYADVDAGVLKSLPLCSSPM